MASIPHTSASWVFPRAAISPLPSVYLRPGRQMTDAERKQYALVDNVTRLTPPAFLLHAYDDDVVPIEESLLYAQALAAAGRDVEVHFFAHGGHGFGPGRPGDGTSQWLSLLANWIKRQ